jgi:hypothetical protein
VLDLAELEQQIASCADVASIVLVVRAAIGQADESRKGGEVYDGFNPQHSQFLNQKAPLFGAITFSGYLSRFCDFRSKKRKPRRARAGLSWAT